MVDSRCHSLMGPRSSTANSSLESLHTQYKCLKRKGSYGSIGFTTLNLSLRGSLTSLHNERHSFSLSREENTEANAKFSLQTGNKYSSTAHAQSDGPAGPQVSTDQETPSERGRGRVKRYASPGTAGRGLSNAVSPDRFIPARGFANPPSTPFRVNKRPQQLSAEEKLLRRRSPRADPFMPVRSRRSASAPRMQRSPQRRHSPHYAPHFVNDSAVFGSHGPNGAGDALRQISSGAVWNVGGSSAVLGRMPMAIADGTGGLLGSGTTAPMYTARFLERITTAEEREKHESRVALALDIDPTTRLLDTCIHSPIFESKPSPSSPDYEDYISFDWKDNEWKRSQRANCLATISRNRRRIVPSRPFRVLEAPHLRDDFYCSTLAYSSTSGILAVGLGNRVYLWSESLGVQYPPFIDQHASNFVTSLSFSSGQGERSILAVGRQSGLLCLWSTFDAEVRFEISHPNAISCVAFKQTTTRRLSERFSDTIVDTEDLAVGDELGNIWYYSVEWPDEEVREQFDWNGSMTLLAKISAHTQQICGLAWSPDETYLATGGNDNSCLLFELEDIISPEQLGIPLAAPRAQPSQDAICRGPFSRLAGHTSAKRLFDRRHLISHLLPSWAHSQIKPLSTSILNHTGSLISGRGRTILVPSNRQKHRLTHSAAVKAIAFAPWQPSLLATGGGSNDRAIHFYHTPSGACLATINVFAQVTSLIWSKTRPELVATFGYAQPEHPFRIAIFAWPSCEQIAAIPWGPQGSNSDSVDNEYLGDCGRALWAVSYPGWTDDMADDVVDEQDTSTTATAATDTHLTRRQRAHLRHPVGPTFVRPKEKEGGLWCSRTVEEGCIIVASSDQSVKFHEVWCGSKKGPATASGVLGGSEILEELEGIERQGKDIIR